MTKLKNRKKFRPISPSFVEEITVIEQPNGYNPNQSVKEFLLKIISTINTIKVYYPFIITLYMYMFLKDFYHLFAIYIIAFLYFLTSIKLLNFLLLYNSTQSNKSSV